MSANVRVKRIYTLKNTYSGVVGEMAVATALIRAGHRVAKPYWNDDEVDLVVFAKEGLSLLPIPVQVKSVQRLDNEGCEFATEGLKKKYIDRQPALCLGIYCPESNKIWFIPGAHNIRDVHRAGVLASQSRPGRSRTPYDSLSPDNDVNVYVNLTVEGDKTFDSRWLVDTTSPMKLNKAINDLATRFEVDALSQMVDAFWEFHDDIQIDPEEQAEADIIG